MSFIRGTLQTLALLGAAAVLAPASAWAQAANDVDCAGCVNTPDIADGAVTGNKLGNGSILTGKFADQSVTGNKLANGSILTGKFADGSVTGNKIAQGAILAGKLANGAVRTGKIAAGAVTAAKLAPDAVTGAAILDSSVTGADLAAGTVGSAELALGAVGTGHLSPAVRDAFAPANPPISPVIGTLLIEGFDTSDPIDVRGLSWTFSNIAEFGGGGASRTEGSANVQDVVVTIAADRADIATLALSAVSGNAPLATISLGVKSTEPILLDLGEVIFTEISYLPPPRDGAPFLAQIAMDVGSFTLSTTSKALGYEVGTGTGTFCSPSSLDFAHAVDPAVILAEGVTRISDYGFNVSRAVADFGQASPPSFAPLSIRSDFGEESPCLVSAVCASPVLPDLLVETWTPASQVLPTAEILLEGVIAASFELISSDTGNIEQIVTFVFERVTWIHRDFDGSGDLVSEVQENWDVLTETSF